VIRRWIFNITAVVSLLLCLATVAVWVRSHYFLDGITVLQWHSLHVESLAGSGCLGWSADESPPWNAKPLPPMHVFIRGKPYLESGYDMEVMKWHVAGVGYLSVDIPLASGQVAKPRGLIVPYWLPASCTAMMPALWLIARLRNRSKRLVGRCATCGYNLTANTSGVCPECGTDVLRGLGTKR
jgi:hypothetical protein